MTVIPGPDISEDRAVALALRGAVSHLNSVLSRAAKLDLEVLLVARAFEFLVDQDFRIVVKSITRKTVTDL